MKFLGYAYRFLSNFVFLALVYYSLNFMEKYQQRAIVAILVLVYASMRAVSHFVRFIFSSGSSGLSLRRAALRVSPARSRAHASRKHIVNDVASLRRDGRNEVLHRPVVSDLGYRAVHFKDRDGLKPSSASFLIGPDAERASVAMRGDPRAAFLCDRRAEPRACPERCLSRVARPESAASAEISLPMPFGFFDSGSRLFA